MIRRVLHTTVSATVLSAALAMSWTAVTVTVAVVLVLTIALCWVVASLPTQTAPTGLRCCSPPGDTEHLSLLATHAHRAHPQPTGRQQLSKLASPPDHRPSATPCQIEELARETTGETQRQPV
jgi:hypothetical protein